MSTLRRLAAEPLSIFVILGVFIFVASNWFGSDEDGRTIVVDHAGLLSFIRQQSRDFSPGHAELRWEQADAEAREDLINQYVREEALYREAKALGYAEQDYVIRRRLVQRIELLAQGLATSNVQIDDSTIASFYNSNTEQYVLPDRVSFTHVFVKFGEQAQALAAAKLAELNTSGVSQAQASGHGDRFLYHLNYVDRTLDFVSSHFGTEFTRTLMTMAADAEVWQGPVASEHGMHLVLFTRHDQARMPRLEDVTDRVVVDLRYQLIREKSEQLIEQTIDNYLIDNRLSNASGEFTQPR